VTIGGFDKTATPTIKGGFLCVGSQSSDIQVVEAEAGTATAYTSVADAAALARGGSVLRYTPTGTAAAKSGTITLSLIGGSPIAIIAAVRNNSASTTWLLHANLSGLANEVSTPDVLIDTSSVAPRLVLLGTTIGVGLTKISVTVAASAASGTLDIDYLIVVNLRDESVAVIAHDDISLASLGAGSVTLVAQFLPYASIVPLLFASGAGGSVSASYRGVLPFQARDANAYALWTATNGAFWRFTNTSNAIVNVTLNCGRYRAYLTGQ
jgi:hypothetical protein